MKVVYNKDNSLKYNAYFLNENKEYDVISEENDADGNLNYFVIDEDTENLGEPTPYRAEIFTKKS